jgi:integrase-like protein
LRRLLEPGQYTSWAFGKRLREAGLLGSMGTVGDCYDNSMMESFRGTMQLELLDRKARKSRKELANAIFEWIECWYNPDEGIPVSGCSAPPTTRPDSGRQTTVPDPTPEVSGEQGQAHSCGLK